MATAAGHSALAASCLPLLLLLSTLSTWGLWWALAAASLILWLSLRVWLRKSLKGRQEEEGKELFLWADPRLPWTDSPAAS